MLQTVMVLSKDDFLIRVKKCDDDSYKLEFLKDRFKTLKTKEYASRKEQLDVLEMQFEQDELLGIWQVWMSFIL